MGPTNEDIRSALAGIEEHGFESHVLDDAWYSQRALTRAVGGDFANLPAVSVVRVNLPKMGCVELHPTDDGQIKLMCYCCFGGNPDQGIVPLQSLREKVLTLKDHSCPPWPG